MSLWIFRLSTLVAFPLFTYTYVLTTKNGFMAGLVCGILVVISEFFLKNLKIMKVMITLFGGLMGYFIYAYFDHLFLRTDIFELEQFWNLYSSYVQSGLIIAGALLSLWRSDDLEGLSKKGSYLKVIDLTALVDGRVVDLVDTCFLAGTVVLPKIVLDKLDILAGSKDPLEAAKGRRGLDVVARLQENKDLPIKITSKAFDCSTPEEEIVRIAAYLKAEVVTLDFNVSKMGAIHNVIVLNISDLSTALKPVILPGESMSIFIMKEGKEKNQGIGYLDDGTMVVVEDGKRHVGKREEVAVYSILQTSAGRMIFAKMK